MPGRKKKPKPKHVYSYVGEHGYAATEEDATAAQTRRQIDSPEDVSQWVAQHGDEVEFDGSIPAIYIVDTEFQFWIASRYSEHIVCARGNEVLAAGEIFFGSEDGSPTVERITNQSTGFCPRPSCWELVDHVLGEIGISHPDAFEPGFVFRWCKPCGNIEIVKDGDFSCLMCGAELPGEWNIDQWEAPVDEEVEDDETGEGETEAN